MNRGRRDPRLRLLPTRRAPTPLPEDNSSENEGHPRFAANDNRPRTNLPERRLALGDTFAASNCPRRGCVSPLHPYQASLSQTSPPLASERQGNHSEAALDVRVSPSAGRPPPTAATQIGHRNEGFPSCHPFCVTAPVEPT